MMPQTKKDGFTLTKSGVKELLNDNSKVRCFELEDSLKMPDHIEIYNFDTTKYFIYFTTDNSGVIYYSKEELIKVATPPEVIPTYEEWIKTIQICLKDLSFENIIQYPILSKKVGLPNLTTRDTGKVEKFLNQGGFSEYDPLLYKEFLIYSLEIRYKYSKAINFEYRLEYDTLTGISELFLDTKMGSLNFNHLVWDVIFEPYKGYFSFIKNI